MKRNTCKRVGMESIAVELSESTTTEELLKTINDLNNDEMFMEYSCNIQYLLKLMKENVLMQLI